jgi:hypothetical protein
MNEIGDYASQTSGVLAEKLTEWVETDACVAACGLQRITVGLSTDALLEPAFTHRFCFSPDCRSKCPNIDDLYTRLAAEEGEKSGLVTL